MGRSSILVAGVLLFCGTSLSAQAMPELTPGDRVRVWAPANGLTAQVATVESMTGATLTLRLPRTNFPFLVSIDSITRLDVASGGGISVAGASIGGLVGLGAGLLLSTVSIPCSNESECELLYWGTIPISFLAGTVLGGLLAADPWTRAWPGN